VGENRRSLDVRVVFPVEHRVGEEANQFDQQLLEKDDLSKYISL
jgi:hypothetical protein